jgi:purine-binding chemotaxis protein CheW
MEKPEQIVVFSMEDQRYGLALAKVKRVVRMVEITPLPKAPDIVHGIVNMQGQVIPVINMRKRFSLPVREPDVMDQLVVADTDRRTVAIVADSVADVMDYPHESVIDSGRILPELDYVEGVLKFKDGLILIHNLDRFLSLEEENALDQAMNSL